MIKSLHNRKKFISSGMTVLDVISKHRKTEAVFRQYDKQAGECICCQMLFEPIKNVAQKYGLNMEKFIDDLNAAVILSDQELTKENKKNEGRLQEHMEKLRLYLAAHDVLPDVLRREYRNIYLPQCMNCFDFMLSEVHCRRIKELMDKKQPAKRGSAYSCLPWDFRVEIWNVLL